MPPDVPGVSYSGESPRTAYARRSARTITRFLRGCYGKGISTPNEVAKQDRAWSGVRAPIVGWARIGGVLTEDRPSAVLLQARDPAPDRKRRPHRNTFPSRRRSAHGETDTSVRVVPCSLAIHRNRNEPPQNPRTTCRSHATRSRPPLDARGRGGRRAGHEAYNRHLRSSGTAPHQSRSHHAHQKREPPATFVCCCHRILPVREPETLRCCARARFRSRVD